MSYLYSTVVGRPSVYGHVINVTIHFDVKSPLVSRHLSNVDADSHLLVVSTWYNGQCKQILRFRSAFYSEIAGIANFTRSNFRAFVW